MAADGTESTTHVLTHQPAFPSPRLQVSADVEGQLLPPALSHRVGSAHTEELTVCGQV